MKSPESGPHYPVFGMGQKNYRFWRDGSEGGGIDEEEVTIPALVIGTERKRKSGSSIREDNAVRISSSSQSRAIPPQLSGFYCE